MNWHVLNAALGCVAIFLLGMIAGKELNINIELQKALEKIDGGYSCKLVKTTENGGDYE